MTKQFENIVNAPHRAFGAARKKVQELNPASNAGRVARGVGITTAGLLQFLFWVSKYVALDNHATRALERRLGKISVGKDKDGNDKKFSAFVRRHPNLSGHALY
ncbi:MAG: hypothetical protein K2L94_03400, partial [Alphaproteobacteria bacterium]|nr:hypothetical protein [Alphaproteobacteria bacterium]